jgi:hypothetical protein
MDIKAILAKAAKGEALSDEEKTALAAYDPDKAADSKAAAARKEAEKQRDALKAQLADLETKLEDAGNAGKSEVELLKKQVEKLSKDLEGQKLAVTKAEGEKRALVRGTMLDRIMAGLKLVDGVDAALPRLALERALADVQDADLESEASVKPVLDEFRAKNKALLLDDSGGGGGTPPKDGAGSGGGALAADKMTPVQREADLKKRGII